MSEGHQSAPGRRGGVKLHARRQLTDSSSTGRCARESSLGWGRDPDVQREDGRRPSVERMLWRLGVELRSHLPLEGMEETESEQEEPSQGRPLPPKPESHVTEVGLPVSEETAAER